MRSVWPLPIAVVMLAGLCPAQGAVEHRRSVRFVYELVNTGEHDLTGVELRLVLPPALARQRIDLLRVGPGAVRRQDGFGNAVAIFAQDRLAPGQHLVAQWYATVALRDTGAPKRGSVPHLSADERARFLADQDVYCIEDPRVRELAHRTTAGVEDDFQKLVALHDVVLDRLRYVRDGRWDPAPVCLERGSGSCSEYTYSLIALARATGLPARWAGATALRDVGLAGYEDRVFHRWAEVWIGDRGWVPVDCSRNDGEEGDVSEPRRYLARLPWPLLVLARGDGGKRSLTGWSYHASGEWSGDRARSRRRGYWTHPVDPVRFRELEEAAKTSHDEPRDPAERQAWLFLKGRGTAPVLPVVPASSARPAGLVRESGDK